MERTSLRLGMLELDCKLELLREASPQRPWKTLEDKRHCVLCEQTITGAQVRVLTSHRSGVRLCCPTPGCHGSPAEWVHPEDPLLSEAAWQDWVTLWEAAG